MGNEKTIQVLERRIRVKLRLLDEDANYLLSLAYQELSPLRDSQEEKTSEMKNALKYANSAVIAGEGEADETLYLAHAAQINANLGFVDDAISCFRRAHVVIANSPDKEYKVGGLYIQQMLRDVAASEAIKQQISQLDLPKDLAQQIELFSKGAVLKAMADKDSSSVTFVSNAVSGMQNGTMSEQALRAMM